MPHSSVYHLYLEPETRCLSVCLSLTFVSVTRASVIVLEETACVTCCQLPDKNFISPQFVSTVDFFVST